MDIQQAIDAAVPDSVRAALTRKQVVSEKQRSQMGDRRRSSDLRGLNDGVRSEEGWGGGGVVRPSFSLTTPFE
jgi:hypothetical protein